MPKSKATNATNVVDLTSLNTEVTLSSASIWLVGDTPLITHAWSEKARRDMLSKQTKAVKEKGKETRDPEGDYRNSLYEMGPDSYGFPVTGFKAAILSMAHKDKGLARSEAMKNLFIDADMVRVRPALAGAICDMPLVRIWGSDPEMREDMVRVGSGLNKTANLSYRAQFTHWAVNLHLRFSESAIPQGHLVSLIRAAGASIGVGEWRNERSGIFGAFHMATAVEVAAWDSFSKGGPTPWAERQLAAE